MTRAALAVASLALAACAKDPCADIAQPRACIAVHLRGSAMNAISRLSAKCPAFGIDQTGPDQSPPVFLPLAVALAADLSKGVTAQFEIDGFDTGTRLFTASGSVDVQPGQSYSVTVDVTPTSGGGDGGGGGPPRDLAGADLAGADLGACNPPLAICGGACVDVMRDPHNCGVCSKSCMSGENCFGGACVPTPVAPLAGTHTHRADAQLTWTPGVPTSHVQVCTDAACASPIVDMDVPAPGMRLPAMPKTRLFWRLRYQGAANYGPTLPFTTGVATGGPDTTTVAQLDWNGDGYADVAIGQALPNGMAAPVWFMGRMGGISAAGMGPSQAPKGFPLASCVGDVNGDGDVDLATVDPGMSLTIDYGAPGFMQLMSAPVQTLTSPNPQATANVGDVDGDGFADVVVVSANRVFLFRGSPVGLDGSPTDITPVGATLTSVYGVGDFNGDGRADFVVAGQQLPVFLVLGPTMSTGLPGGVVSPQPIANVTGGDLDGDGYSDVVVGASGGQLLVFKGSTVVPDGPPSGMVKLPSTNAPPFVLALRDVNGDGAADLAAYDSTNHNLLVYTGGAATATGLSSNFFQAIGWSPTGIPPSAPPPFTSGDYNGDGLTDLALGQPAANQFQVYLAMPPMGMLTATTPGSGMPGFGGVIARLLGLPKAPFQRL